MIELLLYSLPAFLLLVDANVPFIESDPTSCCLEEDPVFGDGCDVANCGGV